MNRKIKTYFNHLNRNCSDKKFDQWCAKETASVREWTSNAKKRIAVPLPAEPAK